MNQITLYERNAKYNLLKKTIVFKVKRNVWIQNEQCVSAERLLWRNEWIFCHISKIWFRTKFYDMQLKDYFLKQRFYCLITHATSLKKQFLYVNAKFSENIQSLSTYYMLHECTRSSIPQTYNFILFFYLLQ